MAWEENIYKLKITDPVVGGSVVFTPTGAWPGSQSLKRLFNARATWQT